MTARERFEQAQAKHANEMIDAGKKWNSASFAAGWQAASKIKSQSLAQAAKRIAEELHHRLGTLGGESALETILEMALELISHKEPQADKS